MNKEELLKEKKEIEDKISELEGKVNDYGDDQDIDGDDAESHESESLATNQAIVTSFRERLDEINKKLKQ